MTSKILNDNDDNDVGADNYDGNTDAADENNNDDVDAGEE